MFSPFYFVCVVLLSSFSTSFTKDAPSYFPKCYRNDPKLNECLVKATETIRPFLIKGIPELNFPSIEPFFIETIDLQQGSQNLNFKASLKNVTVHGLSSYHINKFDFDYKNLQFFGSGWVDSLRLEGKFRVSGKILIAPIEGEGSFTGTVGKCSLEFYQKVKEVKRKGWVYILPAYTNTTIKFGDPKIHLDGLFQDNEQLNKATNDVINDNIEALSEDMKPVFEDVIKNIMENLIFEFANQIPYDKLYPIKKD